MRKLRIGVGGLARAGKDTFCQLLLESLKANGISAKRLALADELKADIRPTLINKYGIDVLNCTPEEKEKIRPELVAYGKQLREQSKGTHWTKIVEEKTSGDAEDVIIVPDIRYYQFPFDEVPWVKQFGLLVHVARYSVVNGMKVWVEPPNSDERANDPLIRAAADFSLSWETLPIEELRLQFKGFLETVSLITSHELQTVKRRAIS